MTTHMRDYASAVARPAKKNRVIRVEDDVWDAAKRRADAEDQVLSEQIREFLRRYGREYREKG